MLLSQNCLDVNHLFGQVGVEGVTYAGCQGLEILHPDGHRYTHGIQQDYKDKLKALEAELLAEVAIQGAWVEHKDLLVAWHYRYNYITSCTQELIKENWEVN